MRTYCESSRAKTELQTVVDDLRQRSIAVARDLDDHALQAGTDALSLIDASRALHRAAAALVNLDLGEVDLRDSPD